ncbi:MAG: hypothetical protein A2340_10400 [Lentisphaerae bacterium RIFOXYB12_FULL_60_10]|nr:MAG: hypothetical protein A2340_10400 [Lentisphaerae bacterium RIFOXYB12_FULL_60_10]
MIMKWYGRSACLSLLLGLLAVPSSFGAIYYVATNGNNGASGLSTTQAWGSISHALLQAVGGDTIRVMPGTYPALPLGIPSAIHLEGSDTYNPQAAPHERHTSLTFLTLTSTNYAQSAAITIQSTNVQLSRFTMNGDWNNDGIPDVKAGIDSPHRPIEIRQCHLSTIGGYGIRILGSAPAPLPSDTEFYRCRIIGNTLSNILHTNVNSGAGIYLFQAPADCISNVINSVSGLNSRAGIYLDRCFYTAAMSGGSRVEANHLDHCTVGVWASMFGYIGESMSIAHNTISNGVIGIRITASRGPASILSNQVHVSGWSPSGLTPARGIWVQADNNPWDPPSMTDHAVSGNEVQGNATAGDGTAGLCFSYNSSVTDGQNNGVRATATWNSASRFDHGVRIETGTNGVSLPHTPLVEVKFHYNDLFGNQTYGAQTIGFTGTLNAASNWWGSYSGPTSPPANPPSPGILATAWPLGRYTVDTDQDGIRDHLDANDDGDRYNDLQEMYIGSDPADAASQFQFEQGTYASGDGVTLSWRSLTNRLYHIVRSTNLLVAFPTTTYATVTGAPPTNTWIDPATPLPPYFYRMSITNP